MIGIVTLPWHILSMINYVIISVAVAFEIASYIEVSLRQQAIRCLINMYATLVVMYPSTLIVSSL